eukprot:g4586.t1
MSKIFDEVERVLTSAPPAFDLEDLPQSSSNTSSSSQTKPWKHIYVETPQAVGNWLGSPFLVKLAGKVALVAASCYALGSIYRILSHNHSVSKSKAQLQKLIDTKKERLNFISKQNDSNNNSVTPVLIEREDEGASGACMSKIFDEVERVLTSAPPAFDLEDLPQSSSNTSSSSQTKPWKHIYVETPQAVGNWLGSPFLVKLAGKVALVAASCYALGSIYRILSHNHSVSKSKAQLQKLIDTKKERLNFISKQNDSNNNSVTPVLIEREDEGASGAWSPNRFRLRRRYLSDIWASEEKVKKKGSSGWASTPGKSPRVVLPLFDEDDKNTTFSTNLKLKYGERRRHMSSLSRHGVPELSQRLSRVAERILNLVRDELFESSRGEGSAGAALKWRTPLQRLREMKLLSEVTIIQLQLLREHLLEALKELEESRIYWRNFIARNNFRLAVRGSALYLFEIMFVQNERKGKRISMGFNFNGADEYPTKQPSFLFWYANEIRSAVQRKLSALNHIKERCLPVLGSLQLQLQRLERYSTLPNLDIPNAFEGKEWEAEQFVERLSKTMVPVALNGLLMVDAATARLPVVSEEEAFVHEVEGHSGVFYGAGLRRSMSEVKLDDRRRPNRKTKNGNFPKNNLKMEKKEKLMGPPAWQRLAANRTNNQKAGRNGRSWAWCWAVGTGEGEESGWRDVLRSDELAHQIVRSLAVAEGGVCEEVKDEFENEDEGRREATSKSSKSSETVTVVDTLEKLDIERINSTTSIAGKKNSSTGNNMNTNSAIQELHRVLHIRRLGLPNFIIAKAPEITCLFGIGLIGACALGYFRDRAFEFVQRTMNGIKVWWYLHVTEPVTEMFNEVVFNEMMTVADAEAMEESRQSLRKMISDYLDDTQGIHHNMTSAEKSDAAESLDISVVSSAYDEEVKAPVKNLMRGDLVRLALIQVQFIKKELLSAMAAMDELLRENHFSAQLLATIPAFFALSAGALTMRGLFHILFRFENRLEQAGALRQHAALLLRKSELLLMQQNRRRVMIEEQKENETNCIEDEDKNTEHLQNSIIAVHKRRNMSARDMGQLTMLLRLLEQLVLSRKKMLGLSESACDDFVDDIAEMLNPDLPLELRVGTVIRMFRTYNFLNASLN